MNDIETVEKILLEMKTYNTSFNQNQQDFLLKLIDDAKILKLNYPAKKTFLSKKEKELIKEKELLKKENDLYIIFQPFGTQSEGDIYIESVKNNFSSVIELKSKKDETKSPKLNAGYLDSDIYVFSNKKYTYMCLYNHITTSEDEESKRKNDIYLKDCAKSLKDGINWKTQVRINHDLKSTFIFPDKYNEVRPILYKIKYC